MPDYHHILGAKGPLAQKLHQFSARKCQQEMASAIDRTLRQSGVFVAESGTGTGKTFAYLAPILMSDRRVLISTGTRHLQDQLYYRDLPLVAEALASGKTYRLLKGRSNYICLHRFDRLQEMDRFGSREDGAYARRISDWLRQTRLGDIAEIEGIPEDAGIWPQVTSTHDNCLGGQCEQFDRCYVVKARRAAMEADVCVINHHLFFADLALQEDGFGKLLPEADGIVFDEAHQIPEIASRMYSQSVSSYRMRMLGRDIIAEEAVTRSAVGGLTDLARKLEKGAADFRLAFGRSSTRGAWSGIHKGEVASCLQDLMGTLEGLRACLEQASAASQGLANCYRRTIAIADALQQFEAPDPATSIAWFETRPQGFTLHLTPVDIADVMREGITEGIARIFISATLAINRSFEHFLRELGLEGAETAIWDSPFDYKNQSVLLLPENMPEPSNPAYSSAVARLACELIEAANGRTFLLFTSYRTLHEVAAYLQDHLDMPLLIQGSLAKTALLDRFRTLGNAVLLGTSSFWEGVDVRGNTLTCVLIDKLPFDSPSDPVVRARCDALRGRGEEPFFTYQVPRAVIALKQGVGRLIRDQQDQGVLVLCDPRLLSKGYGKIFLESLPEFPVTRDKEMAKSFLQSIAPVTAP